MRRGSLGSAMCSCLGFGGLDWGTLRVGAIIRSPTISVLPVLCHQSNILVVQIEARSAKETDKVASMICRQKRGKRSFLLT